MICLRPKEFANILIETVENGNRTWVFGNGGSFTNASHFAEDLSGKNRSTGLLWPISVLGTQQALFTANCNDNAYEEAIAIEIRTFGSTGDLFFAISTSGRSPNIKKALRESVRRGLKTYLLTSKNYANNIDSNINIIMIGEGDDIDIEVDHTKYLSAVVKYVSTVYFTPDGKRKAMFVDRDGTLIPETINGRQLKPEKLMPSIPEMIRKLKRKGYLLILISNQSIVGRNEMSIEKHWFIHKKFELALHNEGIYLNDYYYCLHDKAEECNCRKPKPGLLIKAATDWNIDLSSSYVIGNQESDIKAGKSIGCRHFLLEYDERKKDWVSGHSPHDIINYFISHEKEIG